MPSDPVDEALPSPTVDVRSPAIEPLLDPPAAQPAEIPDHLLRSALEFAVDIAAAGAKLRPPLPHPAALRPFLRMQRLPPPALGKVRRAVEDDPEFLERVGSVASPELVDEIGMLWLARPAGWRTSIESLVTAAGGVTPDGEPLAREQRRREAAEQAATRARSEASAAQEQVARERSARQRNAAERTRLTTLVETQRVRIAELERTVERLTAQAERGRAAELAAEAARAAAVERAADAESARDAALADRAGRGEGSPGTQVAAVDGAGVADADRSHALLLVDRAARTVSDLEQRLVELRASLASARSTAGDPQHRPAAATPRAASRARSRRSPLAIPGGLYGNSAAVAEHLLRVPRALVLLDGYNVAKLGWPALDLDHQREACIAAAEDVARRWGTLLVVVFDGADVVGAAAPGRRLVRVLFSPAGVQADDVLRAEVRAADPSTPVVVVTNDQAVLADVRGDGANTLSSEQFLNAAGRR